MTAEVVILNKHAVAIAADSAATLSFSGKEKVSNSANKLFRMSKTASIGVLVYADSRVNGIPWELIIKAFRSSIIGIKIPTVFKCSDMFISFIETSTINTEESERIYIKEIVSRVHKQISNDIQKILQDEIAKSQTKLTETDLIQIARIHLDTVAKDVAAFENYNRIDTDCISLVDTKYSQFVSELLSEIAKGIDETLLPIIHSICCMCLYKKNPIATSSGIVVTGYGDLEYYPAVTSLTVYGIICGKVLYEEIERFKISHDQEVRILPLAQRDVVDTFMTGINPDFKDYIDLKIKENRDLVVKELISNEVISASSNKVDLELLIRAGIDHYSNTMLQMIENAKRVSILDIVNAVQNLSVPDLSQMAKSLVELTSFRRKVSLDIESVGGPIDVAVISKGDGFVWIERKHYFKKELNEHFFDGYDKR